MATTDEIHTWCHNLGQGRLEEQQIEVRVETKQGFPGFCVHLRSSDGGLAEFTLPSKVADACIWEGKCHFWKEQLHAAIDEAQVG